MKFTKIQNPKGDIIQYRIDDVIVSKYKYNDEYDRHLNFRKGCYNTSLTTTTKKGNYKHTCYLSI